MAAKIAKYVILSIAGLLIIVSVVIAVLDDETIESFAGPLASPVLAAKHTIGHGLGSVTNTINDSVHSIIGGSDSNTTPSVVQALPPPPTPSTIAKPVETKSLAEIATETQQEYAQRQMSMAADAEDQAPKPVPVTQQPATEGEQPNPLQADTPPAPPVAVTENIGTSAPPADAPPSAPEAMMAEQPTTETTPAAVPSDDQQLSETALLQSLNEQPADDVTALPADIAEEAETPESAIEDDPDPMGEKAYAEGLKFYSGDGVERNFGTAAQYFMKAAERGHAEAQYSLGLMNYVGQTGGQDFANAAKWFQMAAESGHVQAQYNLGFLYYEGKGVGQDLKTAYGWIDRAAQQGYAKAVKARDALQKAMPEIFGT